MLDNTTNEVAGEPVSKAFDSIEQLIKDCEEMGGPENIDYVKVMAEIASRATALALCATQSIGTFLTINQFKEVSPE